MTYPTSALTAPAAVDSTEATVAGLIDSALGLSPTGVVLEVATALIGENPVQYIADQLVGDWASLDEAAEALRNLAEFSRRFDTSVRSSVGAVQPVTADIPGPRDSSHGGWTGHAADQAVQYHQQLAAASAAFAEEVDQAAVAMDEMADSVQTTSELVANGVVSLIDNLLGVAACWGSSIWTGPFGVACGAYLATNVYRTWADIVSNIDLLRDAGVALFDSASARAAAAEQITSVNLPRVYDHPAVAAPERPVHPGLIE